MSKRRLIDAMKSPCNVCRTQYCGDPRMCTKFMMWLHSSTDAVEVVRCRECKKYYRVIGRDEREVWGCMHFGATTKADDFCSRGERRSEDE